MTSEIGSESPSWRFWRRRRQVFSMSMIASSTTTPTAITSPARTMTLIDSPRTWSTTAAAMSDSGIEARLMNAVRHSNRKATRMSTTSAQPMRSAIVRLSIAISMNVAGRKIVESISMP